MNKNYFFITLYFLSALIGFQGLKANESLPQLIKNFNPIANEAGTIDPSSNCANCPQNLNSQQNVRESAKLSSPTNKKEIEISVLTLDEANSLVKEFQAMTDIPFDYALDGCFARAHKMATLLDQKKITSGKAFVIGRLFASTKYGPASWRYHVAPVIYVKENVNNIETLVPYIIDPSLSNQAMKYEDWKNLIANGGRPSNPRMPPRVVSYYTNRFVYDPTNVNADLTEYNPGDLADMDATLQKLSEVKKQLDNR